MNWTEIIAIFLTIIFGIPGILVYIRSIPPRIVLLSDESNNLRYTIVEKIKDLEVTYKGTKVSEKFHLITACFYYQGKKDIEKSAIDKPLSLELPDKSIIHDYKVISAAKNFDVSMSANDNVLLFNFNLLKNNDYIYFQVLAELESNSAEQLIPSHRIANLGNVVKLRYVDFVPPLFYIILLILPLGIMAPGCYRALFGMNAIELYDNPNVSVIYYSDNKIVDLDSIRTIYKYKVGLISSYIEDVENKKIIADSTELADIKRHFKFGDNLYSISQQTEKIFNEKVKKDYKIWNFIPTNDTKMYKLNSDFSIKFTISQQDIGFFLLIFFVGFVFFIYLLKEILILYRYSTLIKAVEKIKKTSINR